VEEDDVATMTQMIVETAAETMEMPVVVVAVVEVIDLFRYHALLNCITVSVCRLLLFHRYNEFGTCYEIPMTSSFARTKLQLRRFRAVRYCLSSGL
jgi:hypothetical protein